MNGVPYSRSLQAATWLLATLATLALELARSSHAPMPWIGWLTTALTAGIVVGGGFWLRRIRSGQPSAAVVALVLVGLLLGLPFAAEAFFRCVWKVGESPEIVQLVALRNLMLGLAAVAIWPGILRLSCVLSLFVTLGALMFVLHWPGHVAILLYGIVGIWWLMGDNWERMQGRFAAQSKREIPLVAGTSYVAVVLTMVGVAALTLGGASSAVALRGSFWGSGGTGDADPFAERGTGDGDQLVAATDQAASFGAVESELFLDSEMPSLYDMFNDMYGEPINKPKSSERAIALSGSPKGPPAQRTAQTRQSGREFSTVRRQSSRRPKELEDRDSQALIYVAGRVPLHLRLETFDAFDGQIWSHAAVGEALRSRVALTIDYREGKPWLAVGPHSTTAALYPEEKHVVKIIRLATNRIPTPAHVSGAHVDKVDRLEFYGWTDDDVLHMPGRERIPPLQVIHLRSQPVNVQRLSGDDARSVAESGRAYLSLPDTRQRESVKELARNWTAGLPRGYQQVAAVTARLRGGDYLMAPDYEIPPDCEDAAAHFLLHSRRGPDYLFATSAVVLLRSLGYPARVAAGLHAKRQRYDRLARQTAVLPQDVHFWAEVRLDGETWLTIEPTPGYDVLQPYRTWTQSAASLAADAGRWLVRHPAQNLGIALLAIVAVVFRRELADAVFTLVWRLSLARSMRTGVLATIWLVEQRARLAGRRRPAYTTLLAWYRAASRHIPAETRAAVAELLRETALLLYAPAETAKARASPDHAIRAACHQAASHLTLRVLRRMSDDAIRAHLLLSQPTIA